MLRFFVIGFAAFALIVVIAAAVIGPWAWWVAAALLAGLVILGVYDLIQRRHSVLRNIPCSDTCGSCWRACARNSSSYFIERNFDGRPFDRDILSTIYEHAKRVHAELSFGTEHDIEAVGYEYLVHSTAPIPIEDPPETWAAADPNTFGLARP